MSIAQGSPTGVYDMFDRLTETALVPFTKDELYLLANRHYGIAEGDDGVPIIPDISDVEAPYTDVYATLTHYHMTGWEPAEGGYGIWNDVAEKSWKVSGTVIESDLIAIREAIFASLANDPLVRARTNEQGQLVGYSNECEFGTFFMRYTIGRPYAHIPYFGYC